MGMHRTDRIHVRRVQGLCTLMLDGVIGCVGLPRLTPLEQTAPWVLGAFDLRGELVPVISIELLLGRRRPVASPADLVLVGRAAGFPLGVHTSGLVCIEAAAAGGTVRGDVLDLNDIRLTDAGTGADAEARLADFERRLSEQALQRLEQRARRYGDFVGGAARPAWSAAHN
jgi:hypothetical protein